MLRWFDDLAFWQVCVVAWGPAGYALLAAEVLRVTGDGPWGIVAQVGLALATSTLLLLGLRIRQSRRKLRELRRTLTKGA